jgi:hypothetical protein
VKREHRAANKLILHHPLAVVYHTDNLPWQLVRVVQQVHYVETLKLMVKGCAVHSYAVRFTMSGSSSVFDTLNDMHG